MKKHILLTLISLVFTIKKVQSQIDFKNSTVGAISYWNKGEKYNYELDINKFSVKNTDTIVTEHINFDVEVSVLNSSKNSYTMQWLYKNINYCNYNPSSFLYKMISTMKGIKIIYKIDEVGNFIEVLNANEIKEYVLKTAKPSNSIETSLLDIRIKNMYANKEIIEANSISYILLFHNFFGSEYKLKEKLKQTVKSKINLDLDVTVCLEEINKKEKSYTMSSIQIEDKNQLANFTFQTMKELSEKLKLTPPKREEFNNVSKNITLISKIYETGWLINSSQITTIGGQKDTKVERTIIKLK